MYEALQRRRWRRTRSSLILSTGRTATQFLAKVLHQPNLNIHAYHEPAPDLFDLSVDSLEPVLAERLPNANWPNAETSILAEVWDKSTAGAGIHYIESNPNLSMLLPFLRGAFCNPKLVFITRDVSSYLFSAFNKSPDGTGTFFFYDENDHRRRLTPHDVGNEIHAVEWHDWHRATKIAWWWNWVNAQLLGYAQASSNQVLLLRYEDLFDGSMTAFDQLLHFLGLPEEVESNARAAFRSPANLRLNSSDRSQAVSLNEFQPKVREQISSLTSKTMRELGYR